MQTDNLVQEDVSVRSMSFNFKRKFLKLLSVNLYTLVIGSNDKSNTAAHQHIYYLFFGKTELLENHKKRKHMDGYQLDGYHNLQFNFHSIGFLFLTFADRIVTTFVSFHMKLFHLKKEEDIKLTNFSCVSIYDVRYCNSRVYTIRTKSKLELIMYLISRQNHVIFSAPHQNVCQYSNIDSKFELPASVYVEFKLNVCFCDE